VYIDLLEQPARTTVEVDVCIVGGGAAGISIARELSSRNVSVALLEAGGLKLEAETQALYRGESVGLRYGALDETRFRYFGGSTNPEAWGGWCKPLDEIDLEERPWVPHSGWPLTWDDLEPWYRRAQVVCEAGAFDYDLDSWRKRVDVPLGEFAISGNRIVTQLAQLSPPTRFGRRYRDELGASRDVTVYLHANATRIVTDADGSTAEIVEAVTLEGQRLSVGCRVVILAAGGIENARLLLVSPGSRGVGIGNENDLVGRFFMDHPRLELGSVEFAEGALPNLYDPSYKFRKRRKTPVSPYDHTLVAGSLAVAPEIQQSEHLLNFRAWIVATYPGHGSPAADAMKRLYIGLRERELPATIRDDLAAIARRPDHAAATAIGRLLRPERLVQTYRLVNVLEPEPLPESRVTLSDAVDSLGLPRTRLDWHVGDLVRRTLATAHSILDEDLRRSGVGRLVDPYRLDQKDRFLDSLAWVWHHMGTTRMHADPESGVVDPDCRVHSTTNVYVAGSSVFPTSGNDMPTLTIVALALRLADHVGRRLIPPTS
jgi:choline dehydrogenase-like flavoprotein